MKDIDIARAAKLQRIEDIASKINLRQEDIDCYGKYMAKITIESNDGYGQRALPSSYRSKGKLIMVTAMSPTPFGEGKTTTAIGLGDSIRRLGHRSIVTIREPSLGPVFGKKGGAAGGGYAQVVPMENINLHFTGDFHAVSSANNLLAAIVDNHIYQGNSLNIERVVWRRCLDVNDRQLRNITSGQGSKYDGIERQDGFDITVASEIMAILCLSTCIQDLRHRVGNIIVGYNSQDKPVLAQDLQAEGALTVLLKDAIKPNLVQTVENTPALVHGGPFANIAHGCNSLVATNIALSLTDFVITEAGFGADLGAEKLVNIKCRISKLAISCAVIVATIKALRYHGGQKKNFDQPNMDSVRLGISNLRRHIDNVINVYNVPCVVAINRYASDSSQELDYVVQECSRLGVQAVFNDVYREGSIGGLALAEAVVALSSSKNNMRMTYEDTDTLYDKIDKIAKRIYRATMVEYTDKAKAQINNATGLGYGHLPICIAKTPYSFCDDANIVGAPYNFAIKVREIRINAGAGFVVVVVGSIMTMPGLPKVPASSSIDIDDDGNIVGLS